VEEQLAWNLLRLNYSSDLINMSSSYKSKQYANTTGKSTAPKPSEPTNTTVRPSRTSDVVEPASNTESLKPTEQVAPKQTGTGSREVTRYGDFGIRIEKAS
jgi:hypothetical protein